MTSEEFDSAVTDLTNFMVYLAEPAKLVRYRVGLWVVIFMVIFTIFAFLFCEHRCQTSSLNVLDATSVAGTQALSRRT